jgi:probable HAF family extracellular repeat protein
VGTPGAANDSTATGTEAGREVVVGHAGFGSPVSRYAFRWAVGGRAEDLPTPDRTAESLALGVSPTGAIIGTTRRSDSDMPQGCVWRASGTGFFHTEIPALPGSRGARPNAISDRELVVGQTKTDPAMNAAHLPFAYDGAVTRPLPLLPGGTKGSADGVSPSGLGVADALIVGWSDRPGDALRGVLWRGGAAVDLGTLPGRANSPAYDVNDAGQVVGFSGGTDGDPASRHAYLWQDGTMRDLNDLIPAGSGWRLHVAVGINGGGQIVGYGTVNGRPAGFLLTPRRP